MNKILKQFSNTLKIIILLNAATAYAQPITASPCVSCPINSLCVNPCNVPWVTGSFLTNGRQPLVGVTNGTGFSVQRIDTGLYAITFKKPFCCPISVVATSNIAGQISFGGSCTLTNPRSFSINPIGGTNSNPVALAMSHDGNFLATGNAIGSNPNSSGLTLFGIDSTGCSLNMLQQVSALRNLVNGGMTFTRNGCFVVTSPVADPTHANPGLIAFYSVNGGMLQLKQIIKTDQPAQSIEAVTFIPGATCPLAMARNQGGTFSLITTDFDGCPPSTMANELPIAGTARAIAQSGNNCAAMVDAVNNTISLFKLITEPTCHLELVGTFDNSPNTSGPVAIEFSTSGQFLYVLNQDSNNISAFQVDSHCSSLTQVAGSPFSNDPGSDPVGLAISANQCLAVANNLSDNVSLFRIDPTTGALSQQPGSPFALASDASGPTAIRFSRQGNCLFVANGSTDNVTVFQVSSSAGTGTATQICEAITPGCFIVQLPPQADACATVTFFATPCT